MGRIIVMNHLTLDGVMQGPGRPDEDTRGGFERGGCAVPSGDEAMAARMGERMGGDRAFLFGRRTYEDLLASWNAKGDPFKDALNDAHKYFAWSDPATRHDWPTPLCCTATFQSPWRTSRRARARTCDPG